MNAADFWNDRAAAQRVINEYQQFKAQTEEIGDVIEKFDDAKIAYELAQDGDDRELLAEADEQLFRLTEHMGTVETQSLLSGEHDHRACFVAIPGELVGDPGVVELLDDVTDILGLRLELLVLVDDALCRDAVVPEIRGVHFLLKRISPEDLVVVVKESRGWL